MSIQIVAKTVTPRELAKDEASGIGITVSTIRGICCEHRLFMTYQPEEPNKISFTYHVSMTDGSYEGLVAYATTPQRGLEFSADTHEDAPEVMRLAYDYCNRMAVEEVYKEYRGE